MKVFNLIRKFRKKISKYKSIIEVFIFYDNLIHNLNQYKNKYKNFLFAPVLKSNAYGHGLLEIAKILNKEKDIPFFIVDSLYEARILSHNFIRKDILIIGYTKLDNILNFNSKNFIFNITSLFELKSLCENNKKKIRINLKIDTGMHRQGILIEHINEAIKILKDNNNLILEGICSHFADADNEDRTFTLKQIENWNSVVEIFKNNFDNIKYFHISSTSGVDLYNKCFANIIRLGIGLYGINTSQDKTLNLKGVMRLESIISSIKDLKAGDSVGYNRTYILEKDLKVATVPIGYFEGIDRRLSNIGCFKIGNIYCDIVGRISMNISSINVTDIKDLNIEDKVIIISENIKDKNSVENIAKLCNTIPYEIFIHIANHLKRQIVKDLN